MAREGRARQIIQAFKTAALQQFCQGSLQRYFKIWMGTKGGKYTAGARIHQRHVHHRKLTAQRGVFDQHRKALLFQRLNTSENAWVFGQYLLRHIGQRNFAFNNFTLDRALKNLRQTLYLRFNQGITGTHAVT